METDLITSVFWGAVGVLCVVLVVFSIARQAERDVSELARIRRPMTKEERKAYRARLVGLIEESDLDPRFEREYRAKAFGFFVMWLCSAPREHRVEKAWFQSVVFWHHEATAPASELRGYEVRIHREERDRENAKRNESAAPAQ